MENERFFENKIAILTFTCAACGHARTATARKITPILVLIADTKAGIGSGNQRIYELEINPFPNDRAKLGEYLLRAHAEVFHRSSNVVISDLRN